MATLPRAAKVEIEAVAIVGNIVDVEPQRNDATRAGRAASKSALALLQVFTTYQILRS